jgi:hypothetical protein
MKLDPQIRKQTNERILIDTLGIMNLFMLNDRRDIENHLKSLHETMSIYSPSDFYNPAITEILKSSEMTDNSPEKIEKFTAKVLGTLPFFTRLSSKKMI